MAQDTVYHHSAIDPPGNLDISSNELLVARRQLMGEGKLKIEIEYCQH